GSGFTTGGSTGFNPRPPLLAGESARLTNVADVAIVSIRARHCWRANRNQRDHVPILNRFQSAPAIAGGRIDGTAKHLIHTDVSIRARHCWRANHFTCKPMLVNDFF
ncbi:MAG: hypothetical protein Q8O81_18305, partial [Giesbergeria sp.]|nr:hypothetical protein [Giesbergeria sp.]